jgi:xylan 1,4-beta-xylosidase
MRLIPMFLMAAIFLNAQDVVSIRVHADQKAGAFEPIYSYFGYDEPNFTYAKNGQKLVGELAALSRTPVYIRTHFMLTTGDGTAGFKWGSTNAYTEDAAGKPVYDWTVTDRIIDTYLKAGAKPFVEIGFMPKALSTHPEPYQPDWSPGSNFDKYYLGWTYPPKNYSKWGELVYQWVRHSAEKYGAREVESWYWEVWNEPDIGYWHGTPEEYDQLYDTAVAALKRALPRARIGGPGTTGPANTKAAAFLRQFLEHCSAQNVPLDFITYHAKGRPSVVDGHVRMGISKNAEDVDKGFQIVREFPKFQNLPIVLSESDPEGCAACSARVYPQNAYRNGPLYPAYTAVMIKTIFELADRAKTNIAGMLTWASSLKISLTSTVSAPWQQTESTSLF